MDSRREFIKKAAWLTGAGAIAGILPPAIERAFAINPAAGTTFMDAEHIVILMQENRSFDHCYGTLNGVRGFSDPRAFIQPDKKPVWLQTNEKGETYAPFRLNMKDTNATWMGSLPHSWTDQVDAMNGGKFDNWLVAKKSGRKQYSSMPLTMGYYGRQDIPFYYSLADAFTLCDQNFCSSLTGTTANRLYLMTGTIRENDASPPRVRNGETGYNSEAKWKTFPETLEDNGISWKIYQNELSVGVGFDRDQDSWLANFTDNPIEWFSQYHVKFHPAYIKQLPQKIERLKGEIKTSEEKLQTLQAGSEEYIRLSRQLERSKKELGISEQDVLLLTPENYEKLSQREKDIHKKAFTTNVNDPGYHELVSVSYRDGDTERQMKVPKGDILHQFREDVKNGTLPTVSWLVPPANFSDHPGSPWYGAWCVSETIDILTKNPEVWKKTIFILCYDENDGYFDHVPPFIAPVPGKPETGSVSKSINSSAEYCSMEHELTRQAEGSSRAHSIGLGYRVPLLIASPWSRGGTVCSQVFDHTSILMFMEKFLSAKTGKKIAEPNVSAWRRAVCGDLTSVFKPYNGEKLVMPEFVVKDKFMESIHKAQFKTEPVMPAPLTAEIISKVIQDPINSGGMQRQDKGTRPSCPLPYELYVSGTLEKDLASFSIVMESGDEVFREKAAGSPFLIYAHGKEFSNRAYAVSPGDKLSDKWSLNGFENGQYHLSVNGPNGFFREFKGNAQDPLLVIAEYEKNGKKGLSGNLILRLTNTSSKAINIEVRDNAYQRATIVKKLNAGASAIVALDLSSSGSWYDSSVTVKESAPFEVRLAGRVETGRESISDPMLG